VGIDTKDPGYAAFSGYFICSFKRECMSEREKRRKLRKALLLEVICPAKSRILWKKPDMILIRANYRFLGRERSVYEWYEEFNRLGLSLQSELRKLVKREFGQGFDIKKQEYSGYLGVSSDRWYELVKLRPVT
jgi:hypothetical protein